MRGFTLIELMIVVVIVGILAAIAYPSYQNQVRKSRRADAKAALMETAQQLERCYTRFSDYADANCEADVSYVSDDEFYTISASAMSASAFTLSAAPRGDQVNDTECGTLSLTSTGIEGSSNDTTTDANDCW